MDGNTACEEFSTRPQGGFNYGDGKVQRNGFSGSPKVTYFELCWQEGYLATTTGRRGKGRRGEGKEVTEAENERDSGEGEMGREQGQGEEREGERGRERKREWGNLALDVA